VLVLVQLYKIKDTSYCSSLLGSAASWSMLLRANILHQ